MIKFSVDLWYRQISLKATIPGRYLWGFLIPPVGAIPFLNISWERCFLGCFLPFALVLFACLFVVAERLFLVQLLVGVFVDS